MTTTAQKNAKAGGATGKNRSSMVVVHLRARPPRCKKDERGEGCVLVTSEGPRGSVLVKCRDRRMPSSGGGGRGRQQQQQQQQQQQHASFQFTGNVLREATNDEVFEAVAKEAVEAATDGFNATILAYGQTGSGKTYTMGSGDGSYENRGIIPRALTMVFEKLAVGRSVVGRAKDKVSVSFVEIYNENLIDLLSSHEDPKNAPACVISDAGPDSGVFIRGLTTKEVSSEDEALSLWFEGDAQRAIGSHAMNDRSSRSHAVFTLNIETASFKSTETSSLSSATLHRSKIHLVDLAGSERLRKTKSTGTVMREATFINKSLSVLERVIISLGERNQSNRVDHVPYRSSKLTHLLRDALGGNCKTVMIAHVSSDYQHAEETLTTCQLAKRMMRVENNAKLNECVETPSEKLTRLEREIKKLRAELKLLKSNAAASKKNGSVDNDEKHQRREEEEEDETNTAQPSVVQEEEEEEEEEEVCCATDAVSEDAASISSLGSYESARLNDEARAYDEFKQTSGREKVRELSNGKAASRACKHRVRALSERVNDIKREMDATEKEYERRRKERSEAGTKTGTSSSYGSTRRETGSQEREENENPDVVANLVVDEVLAALRHDIETQTTGAENVADEEEKEEESEETSNEKQDRDDEKGEEEEEEEEEEETLHSLLRPLKASYRLAFDQLLSAKDSLNAAELVVGDLSAKLHDAFVSFWVEKKTTANSSSSSTAPPPPPPPPPSRQNASRSSSPLSSPSGRDKEPSSSAPPLHPPSPSSSQKFYAHLTEQWSSSSSASSSSNQPTVSNSITRI